MMNKLTLGILVVLLTTLATALADDCPVSIDCVDIGDAGSMAAHNAQRWGEDNPAQSYGGRDNQATIAMVWEPTCGEVYSEYDCICIQGDDDANTRLDSGSLTWETITVRYYDGPGDYDSFVISIDGQTIATIDDDTSENAAWKTAEIDVSPYGFTGENIIKIYDSDLRGNFCGKDGQLAINWIALDAQGEIPEFGAIGITLGLAGALLGFIFIKRQGGAQ